MQTIKRVAPEGHVAVNKTVARKLYERGRNITLCGNKVRPCHVFDGWGLGCTVNKQNFDQSFDNIVHIFILSQDSGLGAYAVFYVEAEKDTDNG